MSTTSSGGAGDPLPHLNHRTTTQILRRAAASSFSILPLFLFLSLLLFSFHVLLQNGAVLVSNVIDHDPSLRSLLSRLDIAGKNLPSGDSLSDHPFPAARHGRRQRRRPFLHLTRVGTVDDDFFSGDDDEARSLMGFHWRDDVNGSFVKVSNFDSKLGFSGSVVDNGIRVHEIVRGGVKFKIEGLKNSSFVLEDEEEEEEEGVVDLKIFVAGLELGRRDAAALFFLVSVLSAAYMWVILGFVITYSWVLGIVFVTVVNDLLGRYSSFVGSVWSGSNLGLKRLSGFILMRWAVRDALTQILGLWFFGDIGDQYSFFKLFLRLKLMPFSVTSPWVGGYEKEVSGFLFSWFLLDTVVGFVFSVDSWVAMVNTRSGREIVKEGCYLLSTMIHQAIQIRCLEVIMCGASMRWILARVFGSSFALMLQSLVEVYFVVAWLIFYLSARCKDASLTGSRFGRRELEGLIDGLR